MDVNLAVDLVMACKNNFSRMPEAEIIDTLALVNKYADERPERLEFWLQQVTGRLFTKGDEIENEEN
jgi:hypothetical protein